MLRSSAALRRLTLSANRQVTAARGGAGRVAVAAAGRPAAARYLHQYQGNCNTSCVHSSLLNQHHSSATPASASAAAAAAAAAAAITTVILAAGSNDLQVSKCASDEEASGQEDGMSLEEAQMADWDAFMIKSIKPGEDDDDDEDEDDDDEEEEDDEGDDEEGDEEKGGCPADDAEDCTNGDDATILVDDEQRNNVVDQDDDEEQGVVASSGGGNGGNAPGPADDAEDVKTGGYDGKEGEEAGGEDPYDNLPEEDEPTGCTICLINRQGPCRPFWRKFERCMKDHGETTSVSEGGGEGDNSGEGESPVVGTGRSLAEMCDKYMLPWLNCIQGYRNTYTLITNDFYQKEYVDALEGAVPEEDRILDKEVWSYPDGDSGNLDLSLWDDFVQEEKEKLKKADLEGGMSDEEVEEAINLAKAYLKEKEGKDATTTTNTEEIQHEGESKAESGPVDPVLIAATAKIAMRDPVTGHPIDMAYVRDQTGRILGFEQFSNEKKLMRGEVVEGETGEDGPTEAPGVANCGFHIQPGETSSIQVFALYREDVPCPEEEEVLDDDDDKSSEKEQPKVEEKLYYSQAIPLTVGADDKKA